MRKEELKRRLREYLTAESAILRAGTYRIGDRELRRADLSEVRRAIDDLSAQIRAMEIKHGRMKRVIFSNS